MVSNRDPILLVGAGRSGTNLIAMALGNAKDILNAYEQRYVWNKGSRDLRSDLRPINTVSESDIDYIRQHFSKLLRGDETMVVDKTPANSLRLDYCLKVFPNAKIVNVIRDPHDNISSRIVEISKSGYTDRPSGKPPPSRVKILLQRGKHAVNLLKRRNIPIDRLHIALLDQCGELFKIGLMGKSDRYAERVPGMSQIRENYGVLASLCYQWKTIVNTSTNIGRSLTRSQYLELKYEDLVLNPAFVAEKLADFVGTIEPNSIIEYLKSNAREETVGKGKVNLSTEQIEEISVMLEDELVRFGYLGGVP